MQLLKIANIFPKNHLKNVPCVNIRNCFSLGVVIELISSNCKVIASCADSYITDIFCSCKRVINAWTHTIVMHASIHMPTGSKQKKTFTCVSSLLKMLEFDCSKQWLSETETIFGTFLWPAEHVRPNF